MPLLAASVSAPGTRLDNAGPNGRPLPYFGLAEALRPQPPRLIPPFYAARYQLLTKCKFNKLRHLAKNKDLPLHLWRIVLGSKR